MLPTYGRTHDAHPLLKTFYLPHMQCGQIIFDVKPLARPPCAVKVFLNFDLLQFCKNVNKTLEYNR